jgi:hypothetical protein
MSSLKFVSVLFVSEFEAIHQLPLSNDDVELYKSQLHFQLEHIDNLILII